MAQRCETLTPRQLFDRPSVFTLTDALELVLSFNNVCVATKLNSSMVVPVLLLGSWQILCKAPQPALAEAGIAVYRLTVA